MIIDWKLEFEWVESGGGAATIMIRRLGERRWVVANQVNISVAKSRISRSWYRLGCGVATSANESMNRWRLSAHAERKQTGESIAFR